MKVVLSNMEKRLKLWNLTFRKKGKYVLIRFEYDLIHDTLYLFTKMITNLFKKREERNIFGDNVRRKQALLVSVPANGVND